MPGFFRWSMALSLCLALLFAWGCDEKSSHEVSNGDTDSSDEDSVNSETESDVEAIETFPPESQTPLFEKGLILPPDSLECIPVSTGEPQSNCNHHASTVAELPDGSVAAVWYHGEAEKSKDSRLVWSVLAPGESEWSWPAVIYDDPGRSEGNATIWVNETGRIYVFFVTIFGDKWDEAQLRLIVSDDAGETWSEPKMLREEWCWNIRHRPLRLTNGDLLLPCYQECMAYPTFVRSQDDFETWTEEDILLDSYLEHVGQIQPAMILLDDGSISALTRDGTHSYRIKRMLSHDHGKTWTPSAAVGLPNSGTSIDQVRLLDGNVVVVFNNSPEKRFPLTVALSRDGGATYVAMRDLHAECPEGGCSYHYPSIMQSRKDGSIWVTYTHKRQTIGWAHFNEAWLLEGEERAVIDCLPDEKCVQNQCLKLCDRDGECPDEADCIEHSCQKSCTSDTDCSDSQTCHNEAFCVEKTDSQRVDVLCRDAPTD